MFGSSFFKRFIAPRKPVEGGYLCAAGGRGNLRGRGGWTWDAPYKIESSVAFRAMIKLKNINNVEIDLAKIRNT
jgi:hypothetical protein